MISVEDIAVPSACRSDLKLAQLHSGFEVRSQLVSIGECGLLVGSGRQVLLLNATARKDVENNCFRLPPGFLDTVAEEPLVFSHLPSGLRHTRRTICMFDRSVTLQLGAGEEIETALLPWAPYSEDGAAPDSGACDLTIEALGSLFICTLKEGRTEVLADAGSLSTWVAREVSARIHGCQGWYATFRASGVVYHDKLFAFPGLSHSGKSTLAMTLSLAGHPYFGDNCLAVLDATFETAALPLTVKLSRSHVPPIQSQPTGFGNLVNKKESTLPVRFWEPPPHSMRTAKIERIVFPHYDRDAKPELRRLSLIETVFEMLASESGPVENTTRSWRQMVAALKNIPSFEIYYSSTEESHHLLERIASECR